MSRKCSLTTQTGKIWLVVRKNKDIDTSLINSYLSVYADEYAYIKHQNDLDLNGCIEGTHYHFVFNLKEKYKRDRLQTTLNHIIECLCLDNSFGVEIEKYDSFEGCIQYLTHKNDPLKTQHSKSEIVTNLDNNSLDLYYNVDLSDVFSFDRVLSCCMSNTRKIDVIRELWGWYSKNSTYQRVINEIYECVHRKSGI